MLIGCRLVLGIRCCDQFWASGPALGHPEHERRRAGVQGVRPGPAGLVQPDQPTPVRCGARERRGPNLGHAERQAVLGQDHGAPGTVIFTHRVEDSSSKRLV